MQDTKSKYLREEYTARVNRVIDYIEDNISEDLSLKGGYSKSTMEGKDE
jgi:adenine specific DNA methylase Mod